jgi:hypothetical protein
LIIANDVSRGSYNMGKIRTTLSGGHSALSTIMFERNDQLNAKRQNRYVKLRKPDPVLESDAMSILGSILNVSQEVSLCLSIRLDFADAALDNQPPTNGSRAL